MPRLRAVPRRTTAGVAGLVAAALGAALLSPSWGGPEDTAKPGQQHSAKGPLDESAAQRKARSTGKRVEVTARRDATSTTYALPDGSFELTAYAAPIRAEVDGEWKRIDTTLTHTKDGWAPKAATEPVVFSAGGKHSVTHHASATSGTAVVRPAVYAASRAQRTGSVQASDPAFTDLVTFSGGGHEITMSWPGALPTPVIDGASALYPNVFDGVDLLLTAQDSGFTHVLVVHSSAAAQNPSLAELTYRLSSPDLTFHRDAVTQVVTAEDNDGNELAVSPTPYLWDSAGKPAVTEGADPQPAEPGEEPSPAYSEGPGEAASDNPTGGADTDDTADPQQEPSASRSGTAQQSSYHWTRGSRVTTAAFASTAADDVLALPGLAGPQPGTHRAVGKAELSGQGTGSAVLTVAPDRSLLTDDDTRYPVFIDPSITGKTKNWTTVYKKYPDSNFYDGANYNTGTTEARVGYESTTGGLSRSFFRLGWTSSIKGAIVSSATIRLLETYSWSCSAREMQLWYTGGISSSTTWNNQPSWKTKLGTKSFANGWSSSCPDAYVTYDGKSIAQDAADGGWTSFNIGLRATTEDSSYSWKKFKAEGESAPKITINYNRKPAEPTKLHMTPGPDCDTTSPYASVGASDLTFDATSSDPDGNLKYLDFEVWESGVATKIYDGNVAVDSTGKASITLDGADGTSSNFANGKTYYWRVRAIDSTGAASTYAPPSTVNCGFKYDSSAPNSPKVTSTAFPEDDGQGTTWSTVDFGTAGNFTFSPDGSADTVKYQWRFNGTSFNDTESVTVSAGAYATRSLTPPTAGPNILYVRALDGSGNPSPEPTKYLFYVTPRDTADTAGDVTGDALADLFVIDATGDLRLYPAEKDGDIHVSLPAAHDDGEIIETDSDDDGIPDYGLYWVDDTVTTPALITHNGDFLPGDGIQDVVARMPDGKLYIYPGDGYGSVDVSRRVEFRLPDAAPAPASLSQILAIGDYDNDKRPDMFAVSGTALWAFTGYTGGSFAKAEQITATTWDNRQLINVGDVNGDGEVDLVYRTFATDRLLVRFGVTDSNGGTTLASLGHAADSLTGTDTEYATGWSKTAYTLVSGTPDVNGDGIPDIWARKADGSVVFFACTKTGVGTPITVISGGWESKKAFG
ncbi:FG-GAP-like repeat-containing protein [Streptomyces sp. NBC_00996]|uniref:FG-GAP-like repeat-containing protein n=1 Tax=Streptomyces sp. NBC_00996 TaxID=2903710 RepID=UPI00386634E1|nr:FG-GAP-like repeat-containing protein [Streptomyces sp. NBC_00996]